MLFNNKLPYKRSRVGRERDLMFNRNKLFAILWALWLCWWHLA